jgi:hypothetical protein
MKGKVGQLLSFSADTWHLDKSLVKRETDCGRKDRCPTEQTGDEFMATESVEYDVIVEAN